jgi:hypothetical protein
MTEKSLANKAWDTMRSRTPAEKAAATKKRKAGAKKAAEQVKNKQWDSEKVRFLNALKDKARGGACIVCGDDRQYVLQNHHPNPEKEATVKLCANCHDTVRRGTLKDLTAARDRANR